MDTQLTLLDPVDVGDQARHLVSPVILCGGSGTRLWPVSRQGLPKQFWPLLSQLTLLQETALRASGGFVEHGGFAEPVVICNREHRFLVAEQLRLVGVSPSRMVLEPAGRNSAAAIATAALVAGRDNPDAVLWIMPSDAMIRDTTALHETLAVAAAAARRGHVVTFGMRPNAPETGFGYIEQGATLAGVPGAFEVARFIEKPEADLAAAFVASGVHLWNSGMFVATAATLIREFAAHAPDLLACCENAVHSGHRDGGFLHLNEAAFLACPSISFDYAIAERTDRAAVVPADFAWSDVGSWSAIWDASPKDERGNATRGDTILEDADRCLVRSDGRLTAVVGLQDAVIIVTEDAVLAAHRDCAQQVKQVVDRLKKAKRSEADAHRRTHRPWGYYESLTLDQRYQVKRIVVQPGQKLSLQKHFHRAEHWVVVAGSAVVTRDHERVTISENEHIYLPLGCVHRLENAGRIPLTLIEVQTGSYLGEDDIVRVEDDYGRVRA